MKKTFWKFSKNGRTIHSILCWIFKSGNSRAKKIVEEWFVHNAFGCIPYENSFKMIKILSKGSCAVLWLKKNILQNCMPHWFEMKPRWNNSQFLKIISKTFLARSTFQNQKQTFVSCGTEDGERALSFRSPWNENLFLLLKCSARQKSFWNNLQNLT